MTKYNKPEQQHLFSAKKSTVAWNLCEYLRLFVCDKYLAPLMRAHCVMRAMRVFTADNEMQ